MEDWCAASHKPGSGTSYNALLTIKPSHVIRAVVGLGFGRGRLRYARLILNGRDFVTRETSAVTRKANFATFDIALDKVLDLNDWHAFINALGEAGYVDKGMVSSENTIPLTYAIALIAKHHFGITLPNELDKNRASGPVWNGFLAAQVVLGSRVLFGTGTVAQLLLPASSGTKKAYDRHHIFPASFFKGGPHNYARDRRANFA